MYADNTAQQSAIEGRIIHRSYSVPGVNSADTDASRRPGGTATREGEEQKAAALRGALLHVICQFGQDPELQVIATYQTATASSRQVHFGRSTSTP